MEQVAFPLSFGLPGMRNFRAVLPCRDKSCFAIFWHLCVMKKLRVFSCLPHLCVALAADLRRDRRGAVLIEAAILLPVLLTLLVGTINYGLWFMAAHTIQQAANEGARASLQGLDATERLALAKDAVQRSVSAAAVVNPALVNTSSAVSGDFYTITVSYNIAQSKFFATAILPMPTGPIQRASVVKMVSL